MHRLGDFANRPPGDMLHHDFGAQADSEREPGEAATRPCNLSLHAKTVAPELARGIIRDEPGTLDQRPMLRKIAEHDRNDPVRILKCRGQERPGSSGAAALLFRYRLTVGHHGPSISFDG